METASAFGEVMDMTYVIGVDEVGRGPLAGDVYVAGVMVPKGMERIPGVDDSKRLSPGRRDEIHAAITSNPAVYHAVAVRSVADIDRIGIDRCVGECFLEVIEKLAGLCADGLGGVVEKVRIDGKPVLFMKFEPSVPVSFVVKGDSLLWDIGAASIVAKVERDRYMDEMARLHPEYGWDRNKGYGTEGHIAAIRQFGLTPLHRRKFCRKFVAPAKIEMIEDDDILDMFRDGG